MARRSKAQSPDKRTNTTNNHANPTHPSNDQEQHHNNMGAEQSKQAEAAQTRVTTRKSTGKLVDPKKNLRKTTVNSSEDAPSKKQQRPLGPVKNQRTSAYDILESPVKLPPPTKPAGLVDLNGFSPMREMRTRLQQRKEGNAQPEVRSSPRKKKAAQRNKEDADGEGEIGAAESVDQNAARKQKLFANDQLAKQRKRQREAADEPDEESDADQDGDNVVVAEVGSAEKRAQRSAKGKDAQVEVSKGKKAPPPALVLKKKVGRPRKDHVPEVEDQPSKQKRGPGRPSGAKTAPANKNAGKAVEESAEPAASTRKRKRTTHETSADQQPSENSDEDEAETTLTAGETRRKQLHRRATDSQLDREVDETAKDIVREAMEDYNDDEDDEESNEEQPQKPTQSLSKKRAGSSGKAKANTSSKRRKLDDTTEEPEASGQSQAHTKSQSAASAADQHRVLGQWPQFLEVFRLTDDIGRPTEGRGVTKVRERRVAIDLDDSQVKVTVKLCKKIITSYDKIKNGSNEDDESAPEDEPLEMLRDLEQCIDGLCRGNEAFEYDETNVERCTSIYYHLIPKLLKLVNAAVTCYERLDSGSDGQGQITIDHLCIVTKLVKAVQDTIVGAQEYDPRPDTSDHVVQPAREMLLPIRKIYNRFRKHIVDHDRQLEAQHQAQERATQRAADEAEEAHRRTQKARYDKVQDQWIRLHKERRLAEGNLPKPGKLNYLMLPSYDIDSNGGRFTRVAVFGERVGPLPGLIKLAKEKQWSTEQRLALTDGLERAWRRWGRTGHGMLVSVFREYCKPKGLLNEGLLNAGFLDEGLLNEGLLNEFSVTEIVTMAALQRNLMISVHEKYNREVPQWVVDIPDWINIGRALGKENEEDSEEVEVEDEAEV